MFLDHKLNIPQALPPSSWSWSTFCCPAANWLQYQVFLRMWINCTFYKMLVGVQIATPTLKNSFTFSRVQDVTMLILDNSASEMWLCLCSLILLPKYQLKMSTLMAGLMKEGEMIKCLAMRSDYINYDTVLQWIKIQWKWTRATHVNIHKPHKQGWSTATKASPKRTHAIWGHISYTISKMWKTEQYIKTMYMGAKSVK